jgi:hypothetical protein
MILKINKVCFEITPEEIEEHLGCILHQLLCEERFMYYIMFELPKLPKDWGKIKPLEYVWSKTHWSGNPTSGTVWEGKG